MQHLETQQDAQRGGTPAAGAKKRQRVYQQWQGNERFFCWGYLVAGPNWKASIGTAFLIAAPTGIYLAFVAPYMGIHVHAIILVISCILPVLATWFLMLTACRDPGIIPRQEPDQEYLSATKPRTKEVYVNNQRVLIRYNDTCHFYQPPRAHHCSVNDNCIERFDHHCPWVGTTIGLRNYRTFLLFVYTSTVLCLYVFGVCVAMLFVKHNQLVDEAAEEGRPTSGLWGKALGKCVPALALMGYTFLFFWFVGGLSVFHAYLVGTNQTTYENFRYNHDNRPNPYSRGCLNNCAEVWCMRMPPSKVQFRAYIDEFRPPTGQPYSPYLNGSEFQGPGGGGPDHSSGGNGNGGMYGNDVSNPAQMQQQAGMMAPQQQHAYAQGGGPGALGGGGGYAYGQAGAAAATAGGGMPYDPAALQAAAGQQYGAPYVHAQRYDTSGGPAGNRGEGNSTTYSDAGSGWAGGAGPMNEPPAQVKSHHTFTSQSGPGPSSSSPRMYSNTVAYGGPAGSGYGGAAYGGQAGSGYPGGGGSAHYPQDAGDGGDQEYYDDQYDIQNDGYDEYDGPDDEEQIQNPGDMGQGHSQHGGALSRPEQVRPVIMH